MLEYPLESAFQMSGKMHTDLIYRKLMTVPESGV